ncbi:MULTISPECIES: acetate--CoA ligase family protein [Paracoccus]|jgi:acyl-CoA synthetase (NDP forming)|uniref:acetate--CoA ligase family protein n=1 Tax=Paracoccus TaxID=265 RepID=UPI00258E13B7|nr:acetate--CoA ligase family protein [Paracoccus sp. (in: a-proteobacteria)]
MRTEIESKEMLARYGIETTLPELATSPDDAHAIVSRIGAPCALKVVSPDIVHKVDAGGVRLSVAAEGAEDAWRSIMDACRASHPSAHIEGVLVEEMVPAGLEVFIGGRIDPDYGPVVLFGAGGSGVEQRGKPVAALAPLTEAQGRAMVDAAFPAPFAGGDAAGRAALTRCLMAVGGPDGMLLNEEIAELDINPIILCGARAVAVDAVAGGVRPATTPRGDAETAAALDARRARLAGMGALFNPGAIAFVGASTSADKLGHHMIRNLVDFGFTGPIYPIHPSADEICGLKAYPTITDAPDGIDRALVAVASHRVPDVLAECRAKGVKLAQVLTAGFAEFSSDSADLERRMLEQVADGAMRMVGPNCIGTFSAASRMAVGAARYNPTEGGGITFFSQSGTFAGDVVRRAQVWGLPLGRALSCGNCSDVDMVDLLLQAEQDPETEIIAFYMESLRDPGLFFRAAAAMAKPVVILRGAQTEQGQVAASSHTAAMATDGLLWDAALAQSGVIQVSNVDDLMDTLLALAAHGRGPGERLAIFGSGGGVSVTASDAAARAGLVVPALDPATEEGLRRFGIPGTSVANPIDIPVWGLRDGDRYIFEEIINLLKDSPVIDRVVVFVEMGWVLDFMESDEAGLVALERICDSIARARPDGAAMSLALRSSGDKYQDDFVRDQRRKFLKRGISVYQSTSRAVRAQARLIHGMRVLN